MDIMKLLNDIWCMKVSQWMVDKNEIKVKSQALGYVNCAILKTWGRDHFKEFKVDQLILTAMEAL